MMRLSLTLQSSESATTILPLTAQTLGRMTKAGDSDPDTSVLQCENCVLLLGITVGIVAESRIGGPVYQMLIFGLGPATKNNRGPVYWGKRRSGPQSGQRPSFSRLTQG
jgi:hypothetical protein